MGPIGVTDLMLNTCALMTLRVTVIHHVERLPLPDVFEIVFLYFVDDKEPCVAASLMLCLCVCCCRTSTVKVRNHLTGTSTPQRSTRYWWLRRLQMSSSMKGTTHTHIQEETHLKSWTSLCPCDITAFILKLCEDVQTFLCFIFSSFDDDYESEELHVPAEIGNKMDKLVISDLTA